VDLVRNRTIREQREIQPIEDKVKKLGKNGTTAFQEEEVASEMSSKTLKKPTKTKRWNDCLQPA
jgi:hypothetical protein